MIKIKSTHCVPCTGTSSLGALGKVVNCDLYWCLLWKNLKVLHIIDKSASGIVRFSVSKCPFSRDNKQLSWAASWPHGQSQVKRMYVPMKAKRWHGATWEKSVHWSDSIGKQHECFMSAPVPTNRQINRRDWATANRRANRQMCTSVMVMLSYDLVEDTWWQCQQKIHNLLGANWFEMEDAIDWSESALKLVNR